MAGKLVEVVSVYRGLNARFFWGDTVGADRKKPDASFAPELGGVPDRIAVQRVAALPLRVWSRQRPAFTQRVLLGAPALPARGPVHACAVAYARLGEFDKPLFDLSVIRLSSGAALLDCAPGIALAIDGVG
jgi:hypothetical protein